jgi:glycosyltransferase involved in cell wall biosynthesis
MGTHFSKPHVALVYDRVNSWGGAERVLIQLHQLYPEAPLYTSVYDPQRAKWADGWDVRTSWLQRVPWLRHRHRLVGWLMPVLFESFDLKGYDIVISITSEFSKAVITQPNQLHVCYLLTPVRYLWSHSKEYLQTFPAWLQPLVSRVFSLIRSWDKQLALRPDVYIPISQLVANRCQQFYQRKPLNPIYPSFSSLPSPKPPQSIPAEPFFFTWGRHVAYKCFDVAIQAAVNGKHTLIIAGDGPQSSSLRALAGSLDPGQRYVHFVGTITDGELAWYLQNAMCAVFPQEEDFGIAPLEAVSQGCPVIVHAQSGVAEILRSGQDALFLAESDIAMLSTAMDQALTIWKKLDIRQRSSEYAEVVWQRNFGSVIQQQWKQHQQEHEGRS